MTDQEKREMVIKGLECCSGDYALCTMCYLDNGVTCRDTLMRDAIELLKAQEPLEPQIINGSRYIYCGNCKRTLCSISDYDIPNYCSECGRMVKWNDA